MTFAPYCNEKLFLAVSAVSRTLLHDQRHHISMRRPTRRRSCHRNLRTPHPRRCLHTHRSRSRLCGIAPRPGRHGSRRRVRHHPPRPIQPPRVHGTTPAPARDPPHPTKRQPNSSDPSVGTRLATSLSPDPHNSQHHRPTDRKERQNVETAAFARVCVSTGALARPNRVPRPRLCSRIRPRSCHRQSNAPSPPSPPNPPRPNPPTTQPHHV